MSLKPVAPPARTFGRMRRYTPEEVANAAQSIRDGEFLNDSDREPAKTRPTAFQRGSILRKYLVNEQGFDQRELVISTWEDDGQWHWAIGLKGSSSA
jgi:hypothetical protein